MEKPMTDQTTILTFCELVAGDTFQVAPERRRAMRLPAWTYRKVDDISAAHADSGTRGIFDFSTPVVRSESNAI